MKQDKIGLIAVLAFVGYFLLKRKDTPIVVTPPPVLPPITPTGDLTIGEMRDALKFYSDNNGLNWSAKLPKMSDTEAIQLYQYAFECILAVPKCIVTSQMRNRMNLLRNKYQITIIT